MSLSNWERAELARQIEAFERNPSLHNMPNPGLAARHKIEQGVDRLYERMMQRKAAKLG